MADVQGHVSRTCRREMMDPTRDTVAELPDVSRYCSNNKSAQTERTTSCHAGVQSDLTVLTDTCVDTVKKTQTCHPSSQNQVNASDTQITLPSSVNLFNSSGTQIGGGNSIVHNHNNNTYNVTNINTYNIFTNCNQCHPTQHDDLIRWAEQQALESGNQSPAWPTGDVTNQVPNSHSMRKIKTVTSRTATQVILPDEQYGQNDILATPSPQSADDQVMARASSSFKGVETDSTQKSKHSNTMFAVSEASQGTNEKTEIQQAARSVRGKNVAALMSRFLQRISKSAETEASEIVDTVCIIDSAGRVLESGDAVLIGNNTFSGTWAIYVGNQTIVACEESRTGYRALKERLNLTEPFWKLRFYSLSGECVLYTRRERVARAQSQVGRFFTKGHGYRDYTVWVLTGMTHTQAYGKGFRRQRLE